MRRRRGEQPVVPQAEFTSYYGKPVLKEPVWKAPNIAMYMFLGGLAGSSSALAAGAWLTKRSRLARACKLGAIGAVGPSVVALVEDLGRPSRFINMLRVFKTTSPMNMGSWLLCVYGPAAATAAVSDVTGRLPRLGRVATAVAGVTGPAVASYTGALVSDTAVPAWHEGFREMPYIFVGSGASAAGGWGMLTAPLEEGGPARKLALFGAALEGIASQRMRRRLGMIAEPYMNGRAGRLFRAGQVIAMGGCLGALAAAKRDRSVAAASGSALIAASACTRFGIFHAGMESARDPRYTVVPQRERLERARHPVETDRRVT